MIQYTSNEHVIQNDSPEISSMYSFKQFPLDAIKSNVCWHIGDEMQANHVNLLFSEDACELDMLCYGITEPSFTRVCNIRKKERKWNTLFIIVCPLPIEGQPSLAYDTLLLYHITELMHVCAWSQEKLTHKTIQNSWKQMREDKLSWIVTLSYIGACAKHEIAWRYANIC